MREHGRAPADGHARPDRSEVRQAVLSAAREVFREQGYHGATTAAIARRAGYSKGALYSNFEGKADLFLALLADEALARAGRAAVLAADSDTGSTTPADGETRRGRSALALARGLLDLTADRRPILVVAEFRSHVARDARDSRRAGRARSEMVTGLAAWLDDGLRRRGLRAVAPVGEVATIMLALMGGLALEGQSGDGESLVPVETLAAVLSGLVRPSDTGDGGDADDGQGVGGAEDGGAAR